MEYFRVGLIARPHGVHGAVKLIPLTDDVGRFHSLKEAFIERDGAYEPVNVYDVGVQKDAVYAHIEGVNTREAAETLRDRYLCVDRAHAVRLPEDTYFVSDLIGCAVTDTQGAPLGVLRDVYETGALDVYEIQGDKTLRVPALKRLMVTVDTEQKRIVLDKDVLEEVGLFED